MIAWGGHTWSEDDLTGAHASLVTLLNGGTDSFALLNPMGGPMALMATLASFVSLTETRPVLEVMAELSASPLKVLLAAVSVVE